MQVFDQVLVAVISDYAMITGDERVIKAYIVRPDAANGGDWLIQVKGPTT
jgi:hypothetical protein